MISRPPAFGPVIGGQTMPASVLSAQSLVLLAHVPLIVGTTVNEFVNGIDDPDFEQMSGAPALEPPQFCNKQSVGW